MRIAVAGGALQGLEVTYLARKAGYRTLLLDREPSPPALGLAHEFACLDLEDHGALIRALESVDLVIPATENNRALGSLVAWCETAGMPLAFSREAYAVSSSKTASDSLFRRLGIPTPDSWPDCSFPVLAKPDGGSGSKGVRVFADRRSMEAYFGTCPPPGWVLQEYLDGPSYSIEIVGRPEAYLPLHVTDLEMDEAYDCKRVRAPSSLSANLVEALRQMAALLAAGVGLYGIMDVEVILHRGVLKVLEVDARFPSQTPMAVYHATGVNMVELLVRLCCADGSDEPPSMPAAGTGASIVEHIRVRSRHLSVCGEGAMAGAGPLRLEEGFFGAHEALTDYTPGCTGWVATLMIRGSDPADARACRDQVVGDIRARLDLAGYSDDGPGALREEAE